MWVVLCNTLFFDQSQVTMLTDLISLVCHETQKNNQFFSVAKICNYDQFEIKMNLSRNSFWNAKYHFRHWCSHMVSEDHDLRLRHTVMEGAVSKIITIWISGLALPFLNNDTWLKAVSIQQIYAPRPPWVEKP